MYIHSLVDSEEHLINNETHAYIPSLMYVRLQLSTRDFFSQEGFKVASIFGFCSFVIMLMANLLTQGTYKIIGPL